MAPYRVLLVDDEEEVRHAIARKLNWAALGYQLVGEAANGREALELCEALAPDVIFTDIKMPFMDGLTLCRRAKRLYPGVKTVIFSGFDDFEYAREAIKLEVEEYILKPLNAAELEAVFRRVRQTLDREIAESRDMERLRRRYQESQPLMRQQLLSDLLEGRVPADLEVRLQEVGLPAAQGCCAAAVLRLEAGDAGREEKLYPYSLKEMAEAGLSASFPLVSLQALERLVLVCALPGAGDIRALAAALDRLIFAAQKRLGRRLLAGLGAPVPGIAAVARSYAGATEALNYQGFMDTGHCVYIGDIQPAATEADLLDLHYIDDIVRQVKIGRREDLEAAFHQLLGHVRTTRPGRAQLQILQLGLATELVRLIKNHRLETQAAPLADTLMGRTAPAFADAEAMLHGLFESCEGLRQILASERRDSSRKTVEAAKQYMEEHFSDSALSVDVLCGVLNVSPAYFSTLFKRETGQTFVAWLTALRMRKAVEYLGGTDDKTYIIAERVGYTDPNYFSYVFKKQMGVSPSKYRAERVAADG